MPPAERLRRHDVRLEDGELVLRPLTEDDWNALARWRLDSEVLFLAELEDVQERSLGELQAIVREVSQTAFCWIAELDGEPVGDLWLQEMNMPRILEARPDQAHPDEAMWRLDLAFAPEVWGRQLGRRAARLACTHAFEALDADGVWAEVGDHNPRALRMLYYLGFTDAGMRHEPPGRKAFRSYDLMLERARWERTR